MEKKELSKEEKLVIAQRLQGNVNEFEKTIEHAAAILSEITNLTSFAMTPAQDNDTLKFINLLPVDENTVVLMIVAESGKISNTALRMKVPYTEENLQLLAKAMTYNYKGKTISEVLTHNIIENFETDIIDKCFDEGLAMGAWTINTLDSMEKLTDKGVTLITTDCITY